MIYSFHNALFRDQDTGLYNEEYFMEVFYREWHRMLREHHALSIMVIDPHVDISSPQGFDEYVKLAKLINECTFRATDLVSRFKERQFIIGLFDLAPKDAKVVIKRILSGIEGKDGEALQKAKNTFIGALHLYPTRDVDIGEVFNSAINIEQFNRSRDRNYELRQLNAA